MLVLSFPASLLSVVEEAIKRVQRDQEAGLIPEFATDPWRKGECLVVVIEQQEGAVSLEPLLKKSA
jgi:hypothetical protein